jgi:hypothetical protein
MAKKNSFGKGQVLVITAIIVVLVLFLLKVETTYLGSHEFSGKVNLNTFDNIRNELKRSGGITIWSDNYSAVYDFSDFLKDEKDVEIFYSISDLEGSNLNITLVNFLDETIQNINVSQNLTDEADSLSSLNQEGSDYVNFTWTPGSETVFEVKINYTGSTSGAITNHTFTAKAGPARYMTVFYNLRMNYQDSYLEDKFSVSGQR